MSFTGPQGRESAGIVDLVAIRKDHRANATTRRGDMFEMVLIQAKGGESRRPSPTDVRRLRQVARRYQAAVVLSEWKLAEKFTFFELAPSGKDPWIELEDVASVFR